jgi:3-oxoacyl-ACP reductase-like protein
MSIFSSILNKIFHRNPAPEAPHPAPQAAPAANAPAAPPSAPAPAAPVDVEAVLTELAAQKGGGGNWRTSIVDLLKLLDLDSSLQARTALGQELGVHAGADGSAEQNIALQKAVWAKLAENGGHVPASLKD